MSKRRGIRESQGGEANFTGKLLENGIACLLDGFGYIQIDDESKKSFARKDGLFVVPGPKWYARQVRLERNIYNAVHVSDFYVHCDEKYPDGLYIEAKHQGVAGSVDEKYAFLVLTLISFPGEKIIVHSGGKMRKSALDWIRLQAEKPKNNLALMSEPEFKKWAINGGL